MKRDTLIGSAVGSAVLALISLRGSIRSPTPAGSAVSSQAQNVRVLSPSTTKLTTADRQKSAAEDGPWKASRAHFEGTQKNGECPVISPQKKFSNQKKLSKEIARLGHVVLQLQQDVNNRKTAPAQDKLDSQRWCIPDGEQVAAMIAIVPDPVQTNMRLQFDRMIDALQLAAESSHYVEDRYWLPWQALPRVEYADYASRQAALQDEAKKQNQPGLLLFRWNGPAGEDAPSTLYMFLVSDSPTTGINGTQFANAVAYIDQVCPAVSCAQNAIAVSGPTFSGSLASLRRLATSRRKQNFHAYSGTISSACALWMQGLTSHAPGLEQCWSGKSTRIQAPTNLIVRPLMHDTESALQLLTGWLEQNQEIDRPSSNRCHSDLVMFSEAATTYGQTATRDVTSSPGQGNTVTQAADSDQGCYLVFKYPRGISNLRNAYFGPEPTASLAQGGRNAVLQYLPFKLADRESNRSDEPPDFSSAAPLSKEAVLMSFAAELRRRNIRYAGIVGSNILDVLFLANFVRRACPNVRLFVLNADLLFERDLDNTPYIGTLTLTTYPLVPANLDWMPDGQETNGQTKETKRRQMPPKLPLVDQYQEGVYNAALLAIWCSLSNAIRGGAARQDPPAPPDPVEVEYPFQARPQFDPKTPQLPLWLTAIGYGGYWPVRLLRSPSQGRADTKPPMIDEDFSPAWKALAVMVCLFSILHFTWLLQSNWRHIGDRHSHLFSWFWRQIRSVWRQKGFLAAIRAVPRIWQAGWRRYRRLFSDLRFQQGSLAAVRAVRHVRRWVSQQSSATIFSLFGPGTNRRFFFINMANATLVTALGMLLSPVFLFPGGGWVLRLAWIIPVLIGLLFLICIFLGLRLGMPKVLGETRPWIRTFAIVVWVIATMVLVCWWALQADDLSSHYGFFFAYRSVHLATGVSPFTPMIPLLAGFYCWALFEIWRLRFHDDVRPRLRPFNAPRTIDLPGGRTEQTVASSVNDLLLRPHDRIALWLVFILWLASLHPLHPFQVFEHFMYGHLYGFLFCVLVFLMLSSGFRLHQIWSDLKKLLAELDQSHMGAAFDRVREYSWSPIWDSAVREREWTNIDRCLELLKQIQTNTPKPQELTKGLGDLEKSINEKLNSERNPDKEIQDHLYNLLQPVFPSLSSDIENHKWCSQEYTRQMERLEKFVALRYVAFIGGVLHHIRLLIIIVAILFTLILLSLNIYSFEPHQSLIWSFTAMFAVIGFMIVNVLREVHRDNVLSTVTGTKANELGLDFYLRVAAFGAGPLVTLLATHFPAIGGYLFSLLQPGLEAVK
jgi:hypothetical protein